MSLKLDYSAADRILREVVAIPDTVPAHAGWVKKVEQFSELCAEGPSKTHIAFLGTVMLAKAVDARADLFAIKPEHDPDNPHAFSARVLGHKVLVPVAMEFGIGIGVTGREPLNNQPYFRMTKLDDGTPIHPGARASFDYMLGLVRDLQVIKSEAEARLALRAFVIVRRRYRVSYRDAGAASDLSPQQLVDAIRTLVSEKSEGGRRAQAAVAGVLDAVYGAPRVESGRINDPSRRFPGDVCVRGPDGLSWEKAFEVRDKAVSVSDVRAFGVKCLTMRVRESAMVAVSDEQRQFDRAALVEWAASNGLGLTVFIGWEEFVHQALFWAQIPGLDAAAAAASAIHARLVGVEASSDALELWAELSEV